MRCPHRQRERHLRLPRTPLGRPPHRRRHPAPPRIIGQGRALDLILTGRTVDAREALAIGLVNRVVPDGTALDAAIAYAEQVADYPWDCVLADRQSLYEGAGKPLADGIAFEAELGRTVVPAAAAGAQRFASGAGRHGIGTEQQ